MEQAPREAIGSRPGGNGGLAVVAGGDDDVLGLERAAGRLDQPTGFKSSDAFDSDAKPHVQFVVSSVVLEVARVVPGTDPGAQPAWKGKTRQARPPPGRVQPQAVVAVSPGVTDPVRAFENEGRAATALQHRRDRQPRRASADDHVGA